MRSIMSKNAAAARRLVDWARANDVRLEVAELDVTDDRSVNACIEAILSRVPGIDVVINNAARGSLGPIEAFSMEQIQLLLSTNALGPIRVDRAVLPSMRTRRSGLLVHVSSTVGRLLPGVGGVYAATKWALEGLAESLSEEVKPFGVDVAIVEPGAFPATAAMARAMTPENETLAAEYAQVAAPFRLTTLDDGPQDVADTIVRLIEMPAGERPLRTVVGRIMADGVAEYNEIYLRFKARLIEGLE
jgi:NAD(P)-dependent dehydrogenase (short-subunit alcohol dehydrogenase family)